MSATVTVTPASPAAGKDFARIDISGADANRADHSEFRYRIDITEGSTLKGRSYVFNVDAEDGAHSFYTYMFPDAGSYDVDLVDVSDDSVIATAAVTVQ